MGYEEYQILRKISNTKANFFYFFDKITSFFIKSKKIDSEYPKKILIIRNDHIGDLVLCTQIFRELKKTYPEAEITALVSPLAKPIIEKNKNVDKIIPLGLFWRKRNISSFIEYFKVLRKLRKERFDVGVDVRGSVINIFSLLWLAGIKKRIGYYNLTGGKAFLTNPIKLKKQKHTIKIDLDLVKEGLNLGKVNYYPEIITDKEDEKAVSRFIKEKDLKNFICIVPGAKTRAKDRKWPEENFTELVKNFSKKYPNYKILLIGGSEDKTLIDNLTLNKNCLPIINFNLRELSIIFKKSKMVIANDGGPMHIAWVSGAELIFLWGSVNPITMRALKNSVIIMDKNHDISKISLERVEKEINKII